MLAGLALAALAFSPPAARPPQIRHAQRSGSICARDIDALTEPRDELKVRFSRGEEGTRSSFAPDRPLTPKLDEEPTLTPNEQLLEDIQRLMPAEKQQPPETKPIDLNGLQPRDLLIGAAAYYAACFAGWQLCNAAAQFFASNPMESEFYVVARLSGLARVVVVGMAGLGSGVTGIAATGQLVLAARVAYGISQGELDPTLPRDPRLMDARKRTEVEKLLGMMAGGGKRVN